MSDSFFGRRRPRSWRELVEIGAIVLAGVWALYVFVYENRIKPTLAPPTPSIAVDMRHVGNDGTLAVVRIEQTISNPGSVEVSFLGYSLTVLGTNVTALGSPKPTATRNDGELEAYAAFSAGVPVYRQAYLTTLGDPKSGHGLFVQPGQTTTFSQEFYVPRHRFDRLVAWVVAAYSKSEAQIPTTLTFSRSGFPQFDTPKDAPSVYTVQAPFADLDLNAQ